MTQGRSSSDINLRVGEGLLKPLLLTYALSGLTVVSFHYEAPWHPIALLALLVCLCAVQLTKLKAETGRVFLTYRSRRWMWLDGLREALVGCDFIFVTPWMVVVRVNSSDWSVAKYRAILPAATTQDGWRRLQVLIKDDVRSRPELQS